MQTKTVQALKVSSTHFHFLKCNSDYQTQFKTTKGIFFWYKTIKTCFQGDVQRQSFPVLNDPLGSNKKNLCKNRSDQTLMTFHPTVLMNSQVILTFALANKPRKLSRTEDSACTASWGLDLLSLHFIATAKQAQGTHCHLGLKSNYSPCICNSQLQKFHIPNPSFCLLLGGTGNSHPGLSMRSKHLSTTELHSSYPSSFFK